MQHFEKIVVENRNLGPFSWKMRYIGVWYNRCGSRVYAEFTWSVLQVGCLNGGTCVDGVGVFTCECPPLFSGVNCQEPTDRDPCDRLPCLNGGTCTDDVRPLYNVGWGLSAFPFL